MSGLKTSGDFWLLLHRRRTKFWKDWNPLQYYEYTEAMREASSQSGQAQPTTGFASGVFVGRQQEMGRLQAALQEAVSGNGSLLMLVGQPGIGKTRTAQELANYAQLHGALALWGRCYEGQGAPPYWPWVQAIRSYVRDRDEQQLRSEMGAGAADIAEVVSELRERLPDLKPPPVLEPEQARFRLFDSITTFLKNASRRQALVLVLEDLQWADRPSLLLLEFVAKELANSRLLVIGAYRDVEVSRRHPLSLTLGDLTRERLFQRVLLRGLSQEDVGRFIEMVAGIIPPPGLVEAVHRQTEGNPLFVTEVVRLLVQEGELNEQHAERRQSWSVRIPEGIREVIGRRLDRLSERCNQTLTIASVIGQEFALEQLKRLIGDLSEDQLLEAVEEALAARVVEELARSVGRYQFTHTLIQETLAGELSITRRARLHTRIAQELEKLYGANAEAHAAELAYHFAQGQAILGAEKLVKYSLIAGERSLAVHAYEEALGYFQRGLDAKEEDQLPLAGSGPVIDADTAALLFGLGRSQAATLNRLQMQKAADNLHRAFDYYAETGDTARAVAVAEYPVPIPIAGLAETQFFERALSMVSPDSRAAGLLLCRYGWQLGRLHGDYAGAQEAFHRALVIAQREEDTALEMRTLASACYVDYFHLHWQESLEHSLKAIELARHADNLPAEVEARRWAMSALRDMGDPAGMQLHASAMLAEAERLRHRFWLASALWGNEHLSRLKGDWQAARDFSNRGLAVSPMDLRLLSTRVMLEYEVGNFGEGEAYLEQLLEGTRLAMLDPTSEYAYPAIVIPLVTRITGVDDRSDVASAAGETVLSSRSATPLWVMLVRGGLALLAVQQGGAATAAEHYAALKARPGIMLGNGLVAVDRVLGLLAQTMGQLDQAMAHFEDALAFCRRAGYLPELAWTCVDYANALLHPSTGSGRAAPANRALAMSLLDEALAISQELGMPPLKERVTALREQTPPERAAPVYPDGLSQREVEVLRLIILGKSNREIAEELVISLRTVANHVANILNKTNTANRTEAAIYASRQGLM